MTNVAKQTQKAEASPSIMYFATSDETPFGLDPINQCITRVTDRDVIVSPSGGKTVSKILISGSSTELCRVTLDSFDDDMEVSISQDAAPGKVVFEGVHCVSDKGDGIFEITFFGTYSDLHKAVLDAGITEVEFKRDVSDPFRTIIMCQN